VSETVLAHLASALDMVVMEQVSAGTFRQIGDVPPPPWFARIYRKAAQGQRPTVAQAFPVLATFLSEAEAFWSRHETGRLDSGDFVITEGSEEPLPVAATAIALNGRRFLIIQRAAGFEDRQRILQRAREQALAHEQVIKHVQSLRRPVTVLERLAGELADTELSGPQRERMTGMRDHLDTISRVLDGLPTLPEGAAPRKR
jgi:hypothetical protein